MDASAQGETAVIRLPEILDIRAAAPLAQEMLALRGRPATLDASQVRKLGGLCLQVLIAARKTWEADGAHLALGPASDAFRSQLAQLGNPRVSLSEPSVSP